MRTRDSPRWGRDTERSDGGFDRRGGVTAGPQDPHLKAGKASCYLFHPSIPSLSHSAGIS